MSVDLARWVRYKEYQPWEIISPDLNPLPYITSYFPLLAMLASFQATKAFRKLVVDPIAYVPLIV